MKMLTLALLPCLAAPALALQDAPPGPARQMAHYDKMVGHFEGGGTAVMVPGTDAMPWTGTVDVEKVLGGHFVQEKLVVDFGEGMPAFEMRSIMGWDRENARYVVYGVNSMGPGTVGEAFWPDAKTYVSTTAMKDPTGAVITERMVVAFSDAGYSLRMDKATGGGDFERVVEGKFEKKKRKEAREAAANAAPVRLVDDLAPLARMSGKWSLRGAMIMPGVEAEIGITGTETIEPALGGNALLGRVTGAAEGMPGEYEGLWMMFKHPDRDGFVMGFADNMGDCGSSDAHLVGKNKLVTIRSGLYMGQPFSERGILTLGDAGLTKVVSDRYTGTGDGVRSFKATYAKAQ